MSRAEFRTWCMEQRQVELEMAEENESFAKRTSNVAARESALRWASKHREQASCWLEAART